MSDLVKRFETVIVQAAAREARVAEQARGMLNSVHDVVRMGEERASTTIASTLRLQNEQQERMLVAHASSTHSLVGGLKASVERCLIDYDSRIDLVATSQKAQAEAATQQAQAQHHFLRQVQSMMAEAPAMRVVAGGNGDEPPRCPRVTVS